MTFAAARRGEGEQAMALRAQDTASPWFPPQRLMMHAGFYTEKFIFWSFLEFWRVW